MANLVYRSTASANVAGNPNKGVALTTAEVDGNFYGLQVDVNSRALKAGDTFTGNVIVSGTGQISLTSTGDLTAYRSGGLTGVLYLNSAQTKYLFNDGTNYQLPLQGLIVGGIVQGTSFTGAGTGLTGTAAGLNIGGTATTATNVSGGSVSATTGTFSSILNVTGVTYANGGLTVTGAISSTGTISKINPAATNSAAFLVTGSTTGGSYIGLTNTSGIATFGIEGSTPGYLIAGASGYDTCLVGNTGISFSANNGAMIHARLSNGGNLSLLGTLTSAGVTSANIVASSSFGIGTTPIPESVMSQKNTTTATTVSTEIFAIATGTYRSCDFHIQAVDAASNRFHSSRVLVIHDGSTAQLTEYGAIYTANGVAWSGLTATYSASVASLGGVPGIQLFITPVSVNSTVFKVLAIATKV